MSAWTASCGPDAPAMKRPAVASSSRPSIPSPTPLEAPACGVIRTLRNGIRSTIEKASKAANRMLAATAPRNTAT